MTARPARSYRPRTMGASRRTQHGAATLVIVALLFFVLSLTAAYTARNLIFEQRTAAQQYRATQAFDTAEAGLEWAMSMLNGGRIDAACQPTADTTQDSFRQRYLTVDATTGVFTRRLRSDGTTPLWAACQFDGTDWVCSCPSDAVPSVAAPPAVQGPFPAFAVRFVPVVGFTPARPGLIRIEANGCNSFDIDCLTRLAPSPGGSNAPCRTQLCAMLALSSGLKMPPTAAATVRDDVAGGASLTVVNDDRSSHGITVHAGAVPISGVPALIGPAGTPPEATLSEDAVLGGLDPDDPTCDQCLFTAVFGVRPGIYRTQQAAVEIDCGDTTPCDAADLTTAIAAHPGRPLWLSGAAGLRLDTTDVVGAPEAPVLIVVDGPFETTAAAQVIGFVYSTDGVDLAGGSLIRGGLASADALTGTGTATIVYDGAVLSALRATTGSFVRVPGSWRDFQ